VSKFSSFDKQEYGDFYIYSKQVDPSLSVMCVVECEDEDEEYVFVGWCHPSTSELSMSITQRDISSGMMKNFIETKKTKEALKDNLDLGENVIWADEAEKGGLIPW